MITYQYFESEDLLISRFEGPIELTDILSFVSFTRKTKNAKKNLYDVSDADLNIRIEDLPQIISERKKFPTIDNQIAVFLHGKPKDAVLGRLLVEYTKNQYNIHICSSVEFALCILDIQWSNQILEERLKNLSSSY